MPSLSVATYNILSTTLHEIIIDFGFIFVISPLNLYMYIFRKDLKAMPSLKGKICQISSLGEIFSFIELLREL